MASEHWLRWHHGTVTDPKWRVVASRCVTPVTVGHVVAVWAAMVENASQASARGQLDGWDDEDIAALFGFDLAQVIAIREAMQGKTLDGNYLSGWEKRQPKREDSSAERTREYRNRKRDESDTVNGSSSNVTQCDARGEESREEQKTLSSGDDGGSENSEGAKSEPQRLIPVKAILAAYHEHLPMLPGVRQMTDTRRRKLKARWTESPERQTVDYWAKFFAYAAQSDFLTGRDGRWDGCDFEWLIEQSNHLKVTEGKYEKRSAA